jgi:hypothetical protein
MSRRDPGTCLEGPRNTKNTSSRVARPAGRDLFSEPTGYEIQMPTTTLWCWVTPCCFETTIFACV